MGAEEMRKRRWDPECRPLLTVVTGLVFPRQEQIQGLLEAACVAGMAESWSQLCHWFRFPTVPRCSESNKGMEVRCTIDGSLLGLRVPLSVTCRLARGYLLISPHP